MDAGAVVSTRLIDNHKWSGDDMLADLPLDKGAGSAWDPSGIRSE